MTAPSQTESILAFAWVSLFEALQERGVDLDADDNEHALDLLKAYTNLYARYQLERVETEAFRNSEFGVARQVHARIEALGGAS